MFNQRILGGVLFAAAVAAGGQARAACFDHSLFDSILKTNVDDAGFVDYPGIRFGKGGALADYVGALAKADLSSCTPDEKTAFWINAYNAITIQKILDRPKLQKVSDDFKLFDEKNRVAGHDLSLNDIEHRVLRGDPSKGGPIKGVSLPTFDPRLHFALVCAAIDCPKLLNRAYRAEDLNATLDANAVAFANSPKHVRLEGPKGDKLVLSSLMKWYADDFKPLGGVGKYLASLTDESKRPHTDVIDAKLLKDVPRRVDFEYDWTLNHIRNKK